jgi:hypothetical protein
MVSHIYTIIHYTYIIIYYIIYIIYCTLQNILYIIYYILHNIHNYTLLYITIHCISRKSYLFAMVNIHTRAVLLRYTRDRFSDQRLGYRLLLEQVLNERASWCTIDCATAAVAAMTAVVAATYDNSTPLTITVLFSSIACTPMWSQSKVYWSIVYACTDYANSHTCTTSGPVNALAKALYKALLPYFPSLQHVVLKDYKVRASFTLTSHE